jgi:hypothetical protein
MQCMRKRKKLRLVVCKPWCLLWQDSRAAFEFLRLNEHTNLFAGLRLDRHRRQANVFELGHKSGPNSSIFNQNRAGMVRACGAMVDTGAPRGPPVRYWQGETWFFGPRQRVLPLLLRGREFGGDRY